jgi:heat shock protein HtpX
MINVYEQVNANKIRSSLIIGGFITFIVGVVYLIVYTFNLDYTYLIFAGFLSIAMSFGSYFWGDKIVTSLNNAYPASRQKYFNYYTATENLSMAARIPMPKLYVIDDPAPNAFATGRDPEHALVCATTGLLAKLDRSELEAVVAHELAHIKNYDIRLMMIVSILIGTLSIIINTVTHGFSFGRSKDENRGSSAIFAVIGLVLIILAPIIAQLIQLAISRRREYFADASSVMLTRQPQSLINALRKISSDPTPQATASTATASLYISNPFKNQKIASLFSTHPPIEDRIKTLEAML